MSKHRHFATCSNWLLAIRPRTLIISVVPVTTGTVLAYQDGAVINGWIFSCCTVCATLIQIGANLFNDAIDFEKGADTHRRLGPVRVTQSGLIESESVTRAAILAYALAMLSAIPLVIQGGWVIIVLGLVSLYCGYAYTAGPFCLAYKGQGELFVILFFGFVAVMGAYYLQTSVISLSSFIAGLQTGLLASVVIAINNLRDIHQDRLANKNTLAVRFGIRFARSEISGMVIFVYVLSLYWLFTGRTWAFLLPLMTLPMAFSVIGRILNTPPGRIYNRFLYQSIRLFVFYCLLSAAGLLL